MRKSMLERVVGRLRRVGEAMASDREWCDEQVEATWLGSPTGGAWAHVSLLSEKSVVYSFGLAFEISFDRAIIETTGGCRVYGYDPDPRSIEWLGRDDIVVPSQMSFFQAGLAAKAGTFRFGVTDPESMAGSLILDGYEEFIEAEFKTLEQIMAEHGHTVVDYIKMDIEGAEFALLSDWLEKKYSPPVKQLWVEFHPETQTDMGIVDVERLVRSLDTIGLKPVKRSSRRSPKHFLLTNVNL